MFLLQDRAFQVRYAVVVLFSLLLWALDWMFDANLVTNIYEHSVLIVLFLFAIFTSVFTLIGMAFFLRLNHTELTLSEESFAFYMNLKTVVIEGIVNFLVVILGLVIMVPIIYLIGIHALCYIILMVTIKILPRAQWEYDQH